MTIWLESEVLLNERILNREKEKNHMYIINICLCVHKAHTLMYLHICVHLSGESAKNCISPINPSATKSPSYLMNEKSLVKYRI